MVLKKLDKLELYLRKANVLPYWTHPLNFDFNIISN